MNKSCSCISIETDGYPSFINFKIKVAKKLHKCGECHKEIKIGEKYEYVVGTWDGYFSTHKTCHTCLEIRNTFICGGFCFGEILEYLEEHIKDEKGHISEDCLAELTPKTREIICEIIEKYWK